MTAIWQESQTLEFKRQITDSLEKEVVAYLNSALGGEIYIGVNDDGTLAGVENADALMLSISDRIRSNILPYLYGVV